MGKTGQGLATLAHHLAATGEPHQLLPARQQMAFTLGFHIVLVPFGVALGSRHVRVGPRSTLAGAFVATAATRRLTAAVNVDY